MTWTPPTTPTAAPTTSAPIVSWIRRHKVITTIVAVFVGLLILGGISHAAQSHKTTIVYNTQYAPQSPTPQQSAEQQQIAQAQAQTQWMQQQQAAQRQANDNQFEQGLGYAGSQG